MKITNETFSYKRSFTVKLHDENLLDLSAEIHSDRYSDKYGYYNKTISVGIKCGSGWSDCLTLYTKDVFSIEQLKELKEHTDKFQKGAYHYLISQLCILESEID